jgi:hypothetical protein
MNDRYNEIDKKSRTIVDGLGMKIDEGIRELVVLLNYNYIGTIASCWGHKNWGLQYPWININKKHASNILELISQFEIESENWKNEIRILPKSKTLIKGRREFNKFKKSLGRAL